MIKRMVTGIMMGAMMVAPVGAALAETPAATPIPTPTPTSTPIPTPTVTPMPTPAATPQMEPMAGMVFPDISWLIMSQQIKSSYTSNTGMVTGDWRSYVSAVDNKGVVTPVVEDQADKLTWAYSVNKLAVALTVMDKIDKGELKLDQKLTLTSDYIAPGSGLYFLQTVYGDSLTLANLLDAMLLMSDNTAVRMLSQVASGDEINATLKAKGFTATHVDPIEGSRRFYLGQTTPREITRLMAGLADHSLLSESSSTFLLNIMRWVNGYNDGVRHNMSSPERAQIATKYGAYEDSRHEVGIMFDENNKPALIYAFMNEGLGDIGNYGATNPAVEAEANMGREMFDIMNGKWGGRPAGSMMP